MPLILAFNPFAAIGAGFSTLLKPIVFVIHAVLLELTAVTHNLALSLIVLAVAIRLVLWPLNALQFKSMAKMQVMQPQLRAIQQKYQNDPSRLQKETMELYRQHGTSPLAGCLPLMLQLPILFSIYQAITLDKAAFAEAHFLWIGSAPASLHPWLASSLALPDVGLLALYVISMFFSIRLSSPPVSDPQQAQTQQIMAFVSPLMIAFVGSKWPSGLILFWLTTNIMQTIQSMIMLRGLPPSSGSAVGADASPVITIDSPRVATPARNAASGPKRLNKGSRRTR